MPRPLSLLTQVPEIDGVLCDIDDTLTWEGRIVPGALLMLEEAQRAGLHVVPVTGRPAGWVDHLARMWPVDGVVGENGGLWFYMADGRLVRRFLQPEEERVRNRARLEALAVEILARVPGAALASDQPYRELDLAIDFCEDVPALPDRAVDEIVAAFEAAGATAKISSIHVNGWYGHFDKIEGFRRFHQERFQRELDPTRWAWFGDSANDEPMFATFPFSFGVANVARFLPRMRHHPAWITEEPGGHGFVSAMRRILDLRG